MSDDDWDDTPCTFNNTQHFEKRDDGGSRGGGRGRFRGGGGGSDDEESGGRGRGRGSRSNGYGGGGGGYGGRGRGRGGRSNGYGDDEGGGGGYGGSHGRGRGGRGRFNSRNDDDDDDHARGDGGFRGGRGGGGGGRRGGYGSDDNEGGGYGDRRGGGENEEEKPKPVTYVPPEDDDDNTLFGSGISSGINFSKYDSIDIKVSGENAPKPIKDFNSCGLKDILLENIRRSGYKVPTPVQKNSIPIIGDKRDLMACAQTGSGKTAAFLVPIINNLLIEKPTNIAGGDSCVDPNCIILSPTRELCIQIYDEARKFAHGSILKVAKLYGGVQVSYQAGKLSNGCHILVATPGRLLDFVNKGRVRFSAVNYFVLDEADRMLDLGFLPDVEKMLKHTSMVASGDRVTLMFSATFPHEIQQLAGKYLHNYLFLAVGIVGGACADVDQQFYAVSKFDKREKLVEILEERENQNELTLVFVETKRNADFLAVYLCENNFKTTSIHGDRFQSQREEALRDFKRGNMPTLVATAVAARGLDIKNVAHVINYDLPKSIDEYVHRIGRTGRVGNSGKATSFFDSNDDQSLAKDLVKILEQAGKKVPPFLSEAGDYRYGESSGGLESFGGTDIRGDNGSRFKAHSNEPQQVEDEEDWG